MSGTQLVLHKMLEGFFMLLCVGFSHIAQLMNRRVFHRVYINYCGVLIVAVAVCKIPIYTFGLSMKLVQISALRRRDGKNIFRVLLNFFGTAILPLTVLNVMIGWKSEN